MKRLTTEDHELIGCHGCEEKGVCYARYWCVEKKKALIELKRYEDTGLTPEQIAELKERDAAKMCKQSIFDHDSITCVCGSDMDKEVEFMFCPWCGQRLKKWED